MVIELSLITVAMTAGYLQPGASDASASGYNASLTTGTRAVPVHTVSAGKQYIITDFDLFTDYHQSNGSPVLVQLQKNGVTVYWVFIHDYAPVEKVFETQIVGVAGDAFSLLLPQTGAVQNFAWRLGAFEK